MPCMRSTGVMHVALLLRIFFKKSTTDLVLRVVLGRLWLLVATGILGATSETPFEPPRRGVAPPCIHVSAKNSSKALRAAFI